MKTVLAPLFLASTALLAATALPAAVLAQAPAQAQSGEKIIEIKNYMFMEVTVPVARR